MFKRKIYNDLLEWKNISKGKTALLIEGARRVGKTSIALEFGKKEFPNFVLIDFSVSSELLNNLFNDLMNIETFFEKLFLFLNINVLPKGSLIIFDEVQFCNKARQAIKTLVKDGRYFYLETGSLISIKENTQNILIPSEEESVSMNPMDYEEFLWALNLEHEANLIKKYRNDTSFFNNDIHYKLMETYRIYLAIGGMPKVVNTYLETKDFKLVEKEKRNIIKTYEEDLRKIDNKFGTICYLVRKQIPIMLSKHSTRFIVSSVQERSDSILFTNTMEKLIESKMIIAVYKSNEPTGGFALTKDLNNFKIYYNDVGLFTSIIYSSSTNDKNDIYQRLRLDKLHTNLGMLYENACAQALLALNFEPFYYSWYQKNEKDIMKGYEIDFLIFKAGKTIPFEVKSRDVSIKTSLEMFVNKFGKQIGNQYILYPKKLKFNNKLTYLPYYMLFTFND